MINPKPEKQRQEAKQKLKNRITELIFYLRASLGTQEDPATYRDLEAAFAQKGITISHSSFWAWETQKQGITDTYRELIGQYMGLSRAELNIFLGGECTLKQLLTSKGLLVADTELTHEEESSLFLSKERIMLQIAFWHPLDLLELQKAINEILKAYFEEEYQSLQQVLMPLDARKVAESSGLTLLEVMDFRDNPSKTPTRQQAEKLAIGIGMEVEQMLGILERQFGPQVLYGKLENK